MDEGRRYGYERFACGPSIRLEAMERLGAVQLEQLAQQLGRVEQSVERAERRVWISICAVIAVAGYELIDAMMTQAG